MKQINQNKQLVSVPVSVVSKQNWFCRTPYFCHIIGDQKMVQDVIFFQLVVQEALSGVFGLFQRSAVGATEPLPALVSTINKINLVTLSLKKYMYVNIVYILITLSIALISGCVRQHRDGKQNASCSSMLDSANPKHLY